MFRFILLSVLALPFVSHVDASCSPGDPIDGNPTGPPETPAPPAATPTPPVATPVPPTAAPPAICPSGRIVVDGADAFPTLVPAPCHEPTEGQFVYEFFEGFCDEGFTIACVEGAAGGDFSLELFCDLDHGLVFSLNDLAYIVGLPQDSLNCGFNGYQPNTLNELVATFIGPDSTIKISLCEGVCEAERRRLRAPHSLEKEPSVETSAMDKCKHLSYNLELHVTGHLSLLMVPEQQAQAAGCPSFMAHASVGSFVDPSSTRARKELETWENRQAFDEFFHAKDRLFLEQVTLGEFMVAYDKASPSAAKGTAYDSIVNNCAVFVLGIARQLNMKINENVTNFVVQRLSESNGQDLSNSIRKSLFFPSLANNEGNNDESVIDTLVKSTAHAAGVLLEQ